MAREIERKFLVCSDAWRAQAVETIPMRQGYLGSGGDVSVRVRIEGNDARLNLKSATLGVSRDEFEFPLPPDGAREVLDRFCGERCVEKIRHLVPAGRHVFEVDEFLGSNAGLVVAEIELESEDEAFERPAWLGDEVSMDPRYYNVRLLEAPYTTWPEAARDPA